MIGKTNSMSGGDIKPEVVKVQLKTNQSSHTDIVGAKITVNYASVSEVYTWEGSDISIKIPPYLSYTISVNDIDGYKTPDIYNSMAIGGTTKSITFEYKCTIVTVEMDDNQPNYNDISTATATISSSGMTTKTISNGGTAKVPIGNVCTITWSDISGYKTPSPQTFTASGTSVTKIGTYQTEILTVNTVTPSDFSGSYTITVSGFGSHTTASKIYKIPFGTSYTVSASSVQGFSVTNSQSYTANSASRTVTIEYAPKVTDLSMQDIFGNPISQSTANCYVIRETGWYMFPIVYGNAIKDGVVNTDSYTNNGGNYSRDFDNCFGSTITSPYIEEDVNKTAISVHLGMADTSGVFTDISIIDGSPCRYIKFKVNSIPVTGANGVISLRANQYSIMWSWHIWVWADDLTPVEVENATGVKYYFMPVNLASKYDDSNKQYIKNWLYQWGRSVPMLCGKTYNSTTDHPNYGEFTFSKTSSATSMSYGIRMPSTFYKRTTREGSAGVWFDDDVFKFYNLWDASRTTKGISDNNVVKTVYDPCPVGFRVPNGSEFSSFTKDNVVSYTKRSTNYKRYPDDTVGITLHFVYTRHGQTGELRSDRYHWYSSIESSADAYSFDPYYDNPMRDEYVSAALSVRPIQE